MSASVEERAKRRYLENQKRGIETNLKELVKKLLLVTRWIVNEMLLH